MLLFFFSLRSMLESKAFLLSPAQPGVVVPLKHINHNTPQRFPLSRRKRCEVFAVRQSCRSVLSGGCRSAALTGLDHPDDLLLRFTCVIVADEPALVMVPNPLLPVPKQAAFQLPDAIPPRKRCKRTNARFIQHGAGAGEGFTFPTACQPLFPAARIIFAPCMGLAAAVLAARAGLVFGTQAAGKPAIRNGIHFPNISLSLFGAGQADRQRADLSSVPLWIYRWNRAPADRRGTPFPSQREPDKEGGEKSGGQPAREAAVVVLTRMVSSGRRGFDIPLFRR